MTKPGTGVGRAAAAANEPATPRATRIADWRRQLEQARRGLGLSREQLARLAGVSPSTVRGYEDGRRHPKQDSLDAILEALHLDRTQSNPIREAAGFAPVRSLWDSRPDYYFGVDELQDYVERVPWPLFVVNDSMEVCAANRVAGAIWGLDFQQERARRTAFEMNLLAVASEQDFPSVCENWDEILELLCSVYKGISDARAGGLPELGAPSPYLGQVVAHFTETNPRFLEQLIAAWERAVPSPAKVRQTYRIIWKHAAGRMSFFCLMSTANEREGLAFNEWIPVNRETWDALHHLLRSLGDDPDAREAWLMRERRILQP